MAPEVAVSESVDEISRTFHLEIFSEFLNLNNFRVKIFAPTTGKVALANDNYLIISDGIINDGESFSGSSNVHEIKTLVEFSDQLGKPTVLLWLSDTKICVGYDSGTVACFDVNGNILFERKFAETAVQVMKISESHSAEDSSNGGHLWIMHATGQLISVAIALLLSGAENCHNAYKFVESLKDVNDFVVLPFVYRPNAFDVEGSSDATYSILVASDCDAALSMYNIGGKQQFQHLGKLGSYLKNQVSSAITKTFHNIFSFAAASPVKQSKNQIRSAPSMALASLIDFEDSKRTVLRLRMDPSGDLVAAADSLGRVTLYDARLNIIVRLWKGVRDARLAWSSCDKESKLYLSLAIYAPQLGLLSFYAMKHGPCLRIVPIPSGSQCQIYTSVEIPQGPHSHGSRITKCWLARGVEEGAASSDTTSSSSSSSSSAVSQTSQSENAGSGSYSMRIVVMVIDPYAKMDDDLDPTPSSSSASSSSSSSSSTTCEAGTKHGIKQGKGGNESESHLSGGVSRGAGGHIKRGLFSEDEDDDTEEEEEDDDDNAFTDALSDNIGAGAGGGSGDGELCSSSVPQSHAVEAARAATSSSSSSSCPAPPTVREVEVILRKFKATLADHSAACFTTEQQQQHDSISPTTPPSKGVRPADTLDTVEERLLTLMTSLPPLNPSPLLECVTMVGYVELTGRPSRGDESRDDVAALVIRNSVIFSASFHKKILLLLESHIQKMKADLCTGKDVVEGVCSSVPLIEELEREVTFRGSLLSGYSTFKDKDKDKDFTSNTTTTTTTMTQHTQERLAALCKLNTSRAEAMCWLQSTHKRRPSPTPGESPLRPSNSSPSSSSISFTLYRALHTSPESDLKEREAYGKTRGSIMLEREKEEAVRPTIGCTLSRMLSAQSAASWTMAIPGPPTLRFTSTTTTRRIDCMSASPSTRAAVVQFLAAPLVGVDSDVFGLQGFTSALDFAGLTCPSMLLLMLPCVVTRIETSTEEELTSTLLRDVSLSPFQRWFRDSLSSLYDDHTALSLEMKGRVADDEDGEEEEEEGDEEEGEGNEEEDEGTGLRRGRQARNGAVSAFRTALQASTSQGSKLRQSMNSLEVVMGHVLSSQALPDPLSHAPADAAPLYQKGDLSTATATASYDDCVRYLLHRAWSRIRHSVHMEACMAFVALVNETLTTVSEQVTRRSYGSSDLKGTIGLWHNLFQQLRVSIVLDRHLVILKESKGTQCVHAYDTIAQSVSHNTGLNRLHSVFRVLALDTLSFAVRAEDAVEHESHCRAVYQQRVQQIEQEQGQGPGQEQGGGKEGDGVPTAWGSSAESSWRDLLSLTHPSPSSAVDVTPLKKGKARPEAKKRTRRPLLLHFPLHNQPSVLCTYRAIELSSRWTRSPHRIDLLKSAGEHLLSLSAVMRAAVSEAICIDALLPVLRHLLGVSEAQKGLLEGSNSSLAMRELSVTLQDEGAADTFFKAAVELLLYIEQGSSELQLHKIQPTDAHNHTLFPPIIGKRDTSWAYDSDSDDSVGERAATVQLAVWPAIVDPYLSALVSTFHSKHGSNVHSLRVCTAVLRVLQLISTLHLDHPSHLPTSLPNKRHQSASSSGSFSKLFSAAELKVLSSSLDLEEARSDAVTQSIATAREDFLRTCFRRIAVLGEQHTGSGNASLSLSLGNAPATSSSSSSMNASNDASTSASSVCYVLSELWRMKVQWVRSIHLEALLNADCDVLALEHRGTHKDQDRDGEDAKSTSDCSGARDIEVENLLPLISDTALAVRLLVGSLRRRMGTAVYRIQGLPEYGPLLAATDSDAVAWCLNWTADCAEDTHGSSATQEYSEESSFPLRLNFNLDSTRNLIARAHVLLEVTSLGRERDREKEEMKAYRGNCEALLLLCDMLSKV